MERDRTENDRAMARRIALRVREAGGRVFYVGGLVRDEAMGKASKDVDIEVHFITPERLEEILDGIGTRLTMGASFGILGLKGYHLDISMPRKRGREAQGDFADLADPFIGPAEAARRRDLTMNAMMRDVLTGELLDPFGGMEDIKKKVIRHVDDASFLSDRLRVLRAAQFAARFSFSVAEETRALCAGADLSDLPFERVGEEVRKALVLAPAPSVFFRETAAMGQTSPWFREAEGAGWEKCLALIDAAAALRGEASDPEALMAAATVHFLPPEAGEALLGRLTRSVRTLRYASDMRRLGDPLEELILRRAPRYPFAGLFDTALCPEDLCLLAAARLRSRGGDGEGEALVRVRLDEYRDLISRPRVTGADLAARGIPPGPEMGRALTCARDLLLRGVPKERALEETAALFQKG